MEQRLIARVNLLIAKGEQVVGTARPVPLGYIGYEDPVSTDLYSEWTAQAVTFISNLGAPARPYVKAFEDGNKQTGLSSTMRGLGVLRAVKSDLQDGFLSPLRELIHASLFDDFLAMAEHLVGEGYKDAAAVLIGSTLEEHLRKLCDKHSIPITTTKSNGRTEPKKASLMNDDLKNGGYVSQIDWRSAQGWLDIRNDAAHGHYENYVPQQVGSMIDGIRNFIVRNPA